MIPTEERILERAQQCHDTPPRRTYAYARDSNVGGMKKRLRRRGEETRDLYTNVAPDVVERIDELAVKLNVPKWAVVEAAVRAMTPETVYNEFQDELDPADELELPVNVAA